MNSKPTTIKFLHPGSERKLTPTEITNKIANWNTGDHNRKYLEVKGEYLTSLNSAIKSETIGFWGEWEAESHIIKTLIPNHSTLPHYVHQPILPSTTPKSRGTRFLNTDPCVFGSNFLYSNCKQSMRSLQNLDIGDVIIFGSQKQGVFVVDTVFVVGNIIKFNRRNLQATIGDKVEGWFYHLTLNLLAGSHTLYIGATYNNPVNGIFSFFPCVPSSQYPNGFSLPRTLQAYNTGQSRGIRYRNLGSPNVEWSNVVNDVLNSGLCLGIKAII
ncbi:hypothetical protein [Lysinibacillus capsici]|uniref:hypothetical protein n=1 Tax=Lysinibacillus capsici TaxID=2115968 RepID=UPI0034E27F2C